jgi:hypothetical protein
MSFDVFASELSAFFSRILVVGVAAERTVCDEGPQARMRGTKSPSPTPPGTAATFDRNT